VPKRDKSPKREALNLDQEGQSQLTYPNQFAKSFLPQEQSQRIEHQMAQESHYDGIYFEQQPKQFADYHAGH